MKIEICPLFHFSHQIWSLIELINCYFFPRQSSSTNFYKCSQIRWAKPLREPFQRSSHSNWFPLFFFCSNAYSSLFPSTMISSWPLQTIPSVTFPFDVIFLSLYITFLLSFNLEKFNLSRARSNGSIIYQTDYYYYYYYSARCDGSCCSC